ncbi:MAG: carbohydrate kinase [Pseudarcicella sp.]|nr:carbohydrate kinase [Pseudarcicella sp.]MBP6410297.1 carbohydrate kinase [Pseudarcicella sp.]
MLLVGLDIGTSSIKASVIDANTGNLLASATYPETENSIESDQPGWAEQNPEMWWECVKNAILLCNASKKYNPLDIAAIGIAYQMHGLVLVDKNHKVLRPSIIWCDSRAIATGEQAAQILGNDVLTNNLLNSPGNFTASKLAWVKNNEPAIYQNIHKVMLPGDFISMKLTGEISTTNSALSEGIFWDFKTNTISEDVLKVFDFSISILPEVKSVFSNHGYLTADIAKELGLNQQVSITYKAGDQPNNAFSLNVLEPGEVAATAGTSGVVYAVTDQIACDETFRVNTFAHVNHQFQNKNRLGTLLCVNGTGILNRWVKNNFVPHLSYQEMNDLAELTAVGANELFVFPFGNGAERMLKNKNIGSHFLNLDFNQHSIGHIIRASQEGIAFSLKYGMDIMAQNGTNPKVIRAGKANMFLSPLFTQALVNTTGVAVEMYNTDGAKGAAIGAGMGVGFYSSYKDAFRNLEIVQTVEPNSQLKDAYQQVYQEWNNNLESLLCK